MNSPSLFLYFFSKFELVIVHKCWVGNSYEWGIDSKRFKDGAGTCKILVNTYYWIWLMAFSPLVYDN